MRISFFADGSCTLLSAHAAWRFDAQQTVLHLPMLYEIANEHEDAPLLEFLNRVAIVKDQHETARLAGSVFADAPVFEIAEAQPAPPPVFKPGLKQRFLKLLGLK